MFETHKLNDNGFADVTKLKKSVGEAISSALILIPDGRDKSIFITKIEEVMFFATRAIASKDGNFTEIVKYI